MGTHPIFESDFDCLTEMKLLASLLGLGVSKLSPFSDDVLYTIDFVGEKAELDTPGIKYDESDFVIMKTPHNEEYKCYLPQDKIDTDDEPSDVGLSAEDLLDPLMKVNSNMKPQCTPVKLETYWSYELCHGKYIRQYHEEKIKGATKTTEYFLGKYDKPLSFDPEKVPKSRDEVKTKTIDGIKTPFWQLEMTDGTPCQLKPGEGRKTKVQYICNPNAYHNEILSVTETSTCMYEIVILTNQLCSSPLYSQKLDSDTFGIPCQKLGDAPTVPTGLVEASDPLKGMSDILQKLAKSEGVEGSIMMTIDTKTGEIKTVKGDDIDKLLSSATQEGVPDQEQLKKILENIQNGEFEDGLANAILKEAKAQGVTLEDIKIEASSPGLEKEIKAKVNEMIKQQGVPSKATLNKETQKILDEFLAGDYCLRGGQGWWKYEFCYGKHVKQYHEFPQEVGKPKKPNDEIYVGKWDEARHLEWAAPRKVVKKGVLNKIKSSKPTKTVKDEDGEMISEWNPDEDEFTGSEINEVELFYADGDVCDITGKPREVVVRLKCKSGQSSLSLYLLEPKTCSYVLGLESDLLCSILKTADENGLIKNN